MPRIRILLLVGGLLALLLPLGAIGLGQGAGEVQALTLDNGLEVLLVDREGLPITTVDMWVSTGSINETAENNGISHFFEHMLFKGTPRFPGGFDRIVEGLGGRSNASTSFDWTHYYITVPSEHTEVALDIIADITQNSSFPRRRWSAKERWSSGRSTSARMTRGSSSSSPCLMSSSKSIPTDFPY